MLWKQRYFTCLSIISDVANESVKGPTGKSHAPGSACLYV